MEKCYKITNSAAVRALETYYQQIDALLDAGNTLVTKLRGAQKAALLPGLCEAYRFAGVTFKTPPDARIWRRPDTHGIQQPRVRPVLEGLSGVEREKVKAEHERVSTIWAAHAPTQEVTLNAFFEAIGTRWQSLQASREWELFLHEKVAYIRTTCRLASHAQEILASEFEMARHEYEHQQAA